MISSSVTCDDLWFFLGSMVAKISLVKDLKEIVQMDVLKDLMDISVNLQVNM